jgi:hypothetical protein
MLAAALSLLAGLPMPARAQTLPSYARPLDETISGVVAQLDGPFGIHLLDDRGFVDAVALTPTAAISPPGLMLSPGTALIVHGYASGDVFVADTVNARYSYLGLPPPAAYVGPGWWYPGFAYGYGPAYVVQVVIINRRPFFRRHPWSVYARPFHGGGAIVPNWAGQRWMRAAPSVRPYGLHRAGTR